MNRGKVKWFDKSKSFGFITMEDGTDIFVHDSGLKIGIESLAKLEKGQAVEFKIVNCKKGTKAVNVTVVEETSKEDFEKMLDTINSSAQKVLSGED